MDINPVHFHDDMLEINLAELGLMHIRVSSAGLRYIQIYSVTKKLCLSVFEVNRRRGEQRGVKTIY